MKKITRDLPWTYLFYSIIYTLVPDTQEKWDFYPMANLHLQNPGSLLN